VPFEPCVVCGEGDSEWTIRSEMSTSRARSPQNHSMRYEIDGSRFTTLEEFFDEVSRVLIPTRDWGHNLDAFNDILRGGFGTPSNGFAIHWKNHALSKTRLGYEETIRQLERRLERCHPQNRDTVRADLARAQRREGPTVLDWLVEIIRTHGSGGDEQQDHVELILSPP
jgi:RNAse (barnase) inhibitor barstar